MDLVITVCTQSGSTYRFVVAKEGPVMFTREADNSFSGIPSLVMGVLDALPAITSGARMRLVRGGHGLIESTPVTSVIVRQAWGS